MQFRCSVLPLVTYQNRVSLDKSRLSTVKEAQPTLTELPSKRAFKLGEGLGGYRYYRVAGLQYRIIAVAHATSSSGQLHLRTSPW